MDSFEVVREDSPLSLLNIGDPPSKPLIEFYEQEQNYFSEAATQLYSPISILLILSLVFSWWFFLSN